MKKILICMMSLLLCFGLMHAQDTKKVRTVLDKTAATVVGKNGTTANFTIQGAKQKNLSGKIFIKDRMFRIETPSTTIWFNGKTLWTYLKDSDEVNITTPTGSQQASMNPYFFLSLYKKGYKYSMKDSGKGEYVIHLTAEQAKASIPEAYITTNKKTYVPTKIRIRQTDKTWLNISIKNLKNAVLSNSFFTFNKKEFPTSEIIDLR